MTGKTTMPTPISHRLRRSCALAARWLLCGCIVAVPVHAQSPVPAEPAKSAAPAEATKPAGPPLELSSLAWLDGCWRGEVAQYDFREHWLPLNGGLMVGAGHTVFQGKTQEFGYLRLETRPDGVYYVVIPSGKKESPFKLTATAVDDKDTSFTF